MVNVEHLTMEFDLNRGKIRTMKEMLFSKKKETLEKPVNFRALDDVTFHVNKGEIFGVIGNNGAGKSTLLKLISGIMKPTEGVVSVTGTIAPMIELGTGFDYELCAEENAFLSGAVLGYSEKMINEKLDDIFSFSELEDFRKVPIKYFSSGMVARLAFAISTLVLPDVLIVDEILSVGDLAFQKKSYQRMEEMMTSGTTVIYVSHDIDSVEELCHRVMWLEHGKVRMIGDAKEVCAAFTKDLVCD